MKWRVLFVGFCTLGLIFAARTVIRESLHDVPFDALWRPAILDFLGIATWLALIPVMNWLCGRYPLGGRAWKRNLFPHFLAMVVIVPIDAAVYFLLDYYIFKTHSWNKMGSTLLMSFRTLLINTFPFSIFYYGAAAGLCHAFDYHKIVRDRELATSQLETRLAQAQVQALRMQLQPHFLFNTLNTISALVHHDADAADRMITRLSDLLRLSLAQRDRQEVPLKEELELLSAYVEIELVRFRDRLNVNQDIAPEALDALVPTLLLQPLVENAIKHGIQPRSGAGHIEIAVRPGDHRLQITIMDDGKGLKSAPAELSEGVGLGNTRARLKHLYGDAHRFEIRNRPSGGVEVTIAIPFRSAVVG